MSGGVDSSTAAALLVRQGYEVVGVTMHLWTPRTSDPRPHLRRCCSPEEIEAARTVSQALGIPHHIVDFEREFASSVIDYFCQEYLRGRTPNPCLVCNEHIKFRLLLSMALAEGADCLATGHYCRIQSNGRSYELWRARDEAKDQSYVLYMLGQEELSRLLFPVGEYTKGEVRRMAAEIGLSVASKIDSADICFLPHRDYRLFLAERFPQRPGDIVDSRGRIVGRHEGIAGYTIGQRRRLPARGGREPLYVLSLDPATNTVVAGSNDELLSDVLGAEKLSFISGQPPPTPLAVEAKVRYRSPAAAALLTLGDGQAEVRFERPQRAITPGQAVVFYQGEKVLGGGIIAESATSRLTARSP
jgi:tRNA-specific 2-thiouridylase